MRNQTSYHFQGNYGTANMNTIFQQHSSMCEPQKEHGKEILLLAYTAIPHPLTFMTYLHEN
jgi:hypothetical protein